jgi:signal transduction histidine kinase
MWDGTMGRLARDPHAELRSEFTLRDTGQSFTAYTGPVVGADGIPIGRLFVGREITAERNAEMAKEQFVATVSHELRTPLTSILGYLELALEEPTELDPQLAQFLTVAQRNAVRLHEMVDDLLVMSQLQSDRLTFDMAPMDLATVVAESVEAIRPLADKKELQLVVATPDRLPIVGDSSRIEGLVGNLLSNAVKFTPEQGRVEISLHEVGGLARLEVSDSGIGISESDQERLFERFFRAETARKSVIPGTGLGLAICRAIAEAHGGSITVSSTVGQGTRFVVGLPTTGDRGPQ